jgi:GTPase SAR1 family protein
MVHFRTLLDTSECITVAVVGPVSCGKTSFLSMIADKLIGSISKQRSTMTTTVYRGTDAYNSKTYTKQVEDIHTTDKLLRDKAYATPGALSTNLANAMQNNIVDIPRMALFKLHSSATVQLVDIPGLNDSSTKELYFEHLESIFQHFSMVMLIFDINGAMNTDDEMQILLKVVELAKQVYESTGLVQQLFVVANKCDEMTYDATNEQLQFTDAEDDQLYRQLVSRVESVIGREHPALRWEMIRISAENSFIYNKCKSRANANESSTFGFLTDSQAPAAENGLASQYEKKYKDKLGVFEHGKKWHRLNATEQDAYLKDTLTPETIAKSLQESGYETLRKQLDAHLTVDQQGFYLLNNLRVCVKTLVSGANSAAMFAYLSQSPGSRSRSGSAIEDDDDTDPASVLVKNLLEVCEKYESVVSNFKQDVSASFDTFSFAELLKPLFEGIVGAMAPVVTGLQAFGKPVVQPFGKPAVLSDLQAGGQLSDTVRTHETALANVLANLRALVADTENRRVYAGNDARASGDDVLGVSSMVDGVAAVLLDYYKKVVGCDTVAHGIVHDIVSNKIPEVSRTTLMHPLVQQLFANETLRGLPALTLEALLDHSKSVVSYCTYYYEHGFISEAQRNKCLSDFILDMYRTLSSNSDGLVVQLLPYLHSAKHLVWDYVFGSHSEHSVVCERYALFHVHHQLCSALARRLNSRLGEYRFDGYGERVRIGQLVTLRSSQMATDALTQHVSPMDTMEYVCAKWHFPEVFAETAQSQGTKRARS